MEFWRGTTDEISANELENLATCALPIVLVRWAAWGTANENREHFNFSALKGLSL
jgi:hypothetical protein